ncbi:hypothetical protein HZB60_04105 [candidate division KSB1 bacterium]|nr:hypothetical protein [candidate division KSB1 bacterium]
MSYNPDVLYFPSLISSGVASYTVPAGQTLQLAYVDIVNNTASSVDSQIYIGTVKYYYVQVPAYSSVRWTCYGKFPEGTIIQSVGGFRNFWGDLV